MVSVSVDDIQADTELQENVDFTPKQEPVQQVGSLENEKNVDGQTKHNFHYNLWEMEKGGAKTRYQWNMDAIRTLKQIESENRLATVSYTHLMCIRDSAMTVGSVKGAQTLTSKAFGL